MLRRSGELEPLPGESILHKTTGRVAFDLSAPSSTRAPAYSVRTERGVAYITTRRVSSLFSVVNPLARANAANLCSQLVFLASQPIDQFKSFSTLILTTENSHVGSTWGGFGANWWAAEVRPEPDGNIPAAYTRVTMRLTFNDGGHSNWALKYEEIRGRLLHAAQLARDTGDSRALNTIHGEQLPGYSPPTGTDSMGQTEENQAQMQQEAEDAAREREHHQGVPDEPPPDYDEAQAQAVAMQFDQREREENERE
ncbi:hypothetical protein BX600DRAFT_278998 [Xylariales sp. PMI_506]|nr:hypothetical protein BX600DRAFT_278998 [Xylariales sp. PMI_506]